MKGIATFLNRKCFSTMNEEHGQHLNEMRHALNFTGVLSAMRPRSGIVQLKSFSVQEKRRRLSQIEAMIADFQRMANDLNNEIAAEEKRAGITDLNHFAYPTYAKAAAQRRDNLLQSAEDLKEQRAEAMTELEEALAELQKAEALDDREAARERPSLRWA